MNSTSDMRRLVEFAVTRFSLRSSPTYINLLKLVVDFYDAEESLCAPDWAVRRNPKLSHDHCSRIIKVIVPILVDEYGLTVVSVNRKISRYIDHGQPPALDDTRRTSEFYRQCYTCIGKGNWADGIVTFPRNSSVDHPLLEKRQRQRVDSAGKKLTREVNEVQGLRSRGLLSHTSVQTCIASVPVFSHEQRQLELESDDDGDN